MGNCEACNTELIVTDYDLEGNAIYYCLDCNCTVRVNDEDELDYALVNDLMMELECILEEDLEVEKIILTNDIYEHLLFLDLETSDKVLNYKIEIDEGTNDYEIILIE